jgi:hypothetical protein
VLRDAVLCIAVHDHTPFVCSRFVLFKFVM